MNYESLLQDTTTENSGRWAVVTQASPLRVKIDGDTSALGFTPDSLVAGLKVSDRVWVQIINRRLVVLGRSGGPNLLDLVYPVGAIYMSVVNTSPATLFGGTWSALQDRFLLGAGGTYAVNDTGGAATHTLTASEIPAHSHPSSTGSTGLVSHSGGTTPNFAVAGGATFTFANGGVVGNNTGGGGAHNNMPPYLAVYMWKRTA